MKLIRVANKRKYLNNKCWKECGDPPVGDNTVGENVNWCSHYGEQYEVPQKTENRVAIQSSNPILGIYIYLDKTNSKRYMHFNVQSSIIHDR